MRQLRFGCDARTCVGLLPLGRKAENVRLSHDRRSTSSGMSYIAPGVRQEPYASLDPVVSRSRYRIAKQQSKKEVHTTYSY